MRRAIFTLRSVFFEHRADAFGQLSFFIEKVVQKVDKEQGGVAGRVWFFHLHGVLFREEISTTDLVI